MLYYEMTKRHSKVVTMVLISKLLCIYSFSFKRDKGREGVVSQNTQKIVYSSLILWIVKLYGLSWA